MEFKVLSRISNLFNNKTPQNLSIEEVKRLLKKDDSKRLSFQITRYRTYKAENDQEELRMAIDSALDPILPDRTKLLAFYKEALRDPHLLSQIRTNILKAIGSPWAFFKVGTDEIDEEATTLMQKSWFHDTRFEFHFTKWFGHTLLEFQQMVDSDAIKGQEFKKIKVFPREYVRPEAGEIVFDIYASKGIPFREEPWNEWLLEIGDPEDIGLLNIASRYVIWKNYSATDWSRYDEKVGIPILVIKTASQNKDELDRTEEMAANFGSNLWMITDDEDEVVLLERKNTDGYKTFEDKAKFCDDQNSKLVSGQTGTADQKAYVGAAEVQADILDEYVEEAMRKETFWVNDDLKSFLIRHGYPLEGLEFRYLAFQNDDKDVNKGDQPPGDNSQQAKVNFTKPSAHAIAGGTQGTLSFRVESLYHGECCSVDHATAEPVASIADLQKLSLKAAERVYHKKLRAGGVDKKLWLSAVEELMSGISKGYDKNIGTVVYGSPDHQMLTALRYNTQVFAAFKNHHNVNELAKALLDDKGKVRSFSEFKKEAGLINSKYNKNWMRTEYNQAILSARNAQRWQKIESSKHIFPNVKYVAIMDGNTSPICRDLNGGIWNIDDPELDRIAPSNHWGCRSFLQKTKEGVDQKVTTEDIKDDFLNNPGKTGNPFSDSHPYYKVMDQYQDAANRVFGLGNLLNINNTALQVNLKVWESLDGRIYKKTANAESGGFVAIHKKAHTVDMKTNVAVADQLSNKGYGVVIREHIEDGTPNPELLVNEVLSDVKSPKKPNSLDSRLQRAVKQGLNNVVYNVGSATSIPEITKGLRRGFHNRTAIEWIDVVYKGNVVRITRDQYERRVILKELNTVYK